MVASWKEGKKAERKIYSFIKMLFTLMVNEILKQKEKPSEYEA